MKQPAIVARRVRRLGREEGLSQRVAKLIRHAAIAGTTLLVVGPLLLLGNAQVAAARSGTTSKQQLLHALGILRTTPTATDRALTTCVERSANRYGRYPGDSCLEAVPQTIQIIEHPAPVAQGFLASLRHPRPDLGLIRSVRLGRSGDSVTFFPVSWRSSTPSAPRTWGTVANIVRYGAEETEVFPTSVRTLRARGIALFPDLLYNGRPKELRVHDGAIIVPDGVAKITVGTVNLGGGSSVVENVTATVRDNVAMVPLKMPTFKTGFGFGPRATMQATWFDANGKVIRHTTNDLTPSGIVAPQ